jgi:hypothetical protein
MLLKPLLSPWLVLVLFRSPRKTGLCQEINVGLRARLSGIKSLHKSCVTLGKLLNFSGAQFAPLYSGSINEHLGEGFGN